MATKATPKSDAAADDAADDKTGTDDATGKVGGSDDSADDAGADKKAAPKKAEKTYTKAELEAERQKAIADAKKKWEDEKDLSELERIKKENEELRRGGMLRDAKDEIISQLAAVGVKSPELAFRAMQGDLQFDDSGKLTNAKDLIESFKTNYPEQVGTEKPAGGVDAGAGTGSDGKKAALTVKDVEKMTPDQVNENWAEVSKVLEGKG